MLDKNVLSMKLDWRLIQFCAFSLQFIQMKSALHLCNRYKNNFLRSNNNKKLSRLFFILCKLLWDRRVVLPFKFKICAFECVGFILESFEHEKVMVTDAVGKN